MNGKFVHRLRKLCIFFFFVEFYNLLENDKAERIQTGTKHFKYLKSCAALEKHKSQNNEYIHHLINSDSEDI